MSFGQILIDSWVKSAINENGHRVRITASLCRALASGSRGTSLAKRLPSRLYGTRLLPPSLDHLWPKLVFAARKFVPVIPVAFQKTRNNLPPWDANVRLYVVAVKTLSQYIVLINQVPRQGLPQPQTNSLKQKYLLDLEYLNVFQVFVIYAAPRLCTGRSSLTVGKISAERTGNSWPQPPQMITHPRARPSTNGRLLSAGSMPRTRIFSQSGQLAHSTIAMVRVCWIGMHNSCNRSRVEDLGWKN